MRYFTSEFIRISCIILSCIYENLLNTFACLKYDYVITTGQSGACLKIAAKLNHAAKVRF